MLGIDRHSAEDDEDVVTPFKAAIVLSATMHVKGK